MDIAELIANAKIYRALELKSRIQNSKKMYVPFENLPEESKIWVYQSNIFGHRVF
jgi:hypothetical protein